MESHKFFCFFFLCEGPVRVLGGGCPAGGFLGFLNLANGDDAFSDGGG